MQQRTNSQAITGTVSNDGFFPDIDLQNFSEVYRLPATVYQAAVEVNTQSAIFYCNDWLKRWKSEKIAAAEEMSPIHQDAYIQAVWAKAYELLIPLMSSTYGHQETETRVLGSKKWESSREKSVAYAARCENFLRQIDPRRHITIETA